MLVIAAEVEPAGGVVELLTAVVPVTCVLLALGVKEYGFV